MTPANVTSKRMSDLDHVAWWATDWGCAADTQDFTDLESRRSLLGVEMVDFIGDSFVGELREALQ